MEQKKEDVLAYIKQHLKEYLPERYRDYEIMVQDVTKENDQHKTGIALNGLIDGKIISPMMYLEDIIAGYMGYWKMQKMEELGEKECQLICAFMADKYDEAFQKVSSLGQEKMMNYADIKKFIRLRICDPERNKGMLKELVHERAGDFAEYYSIRGIVEDSDVKITNNLMEFWDVSKDDIHRDAMDNAKREYELIDCRELWERTSIPKETELQMYVLSNEEQYCGAGVIMNPEIQKKVAEKLRGDYYVIPASIHRTILIPESCNVSLDMLTEKLKRENVSVVSESDFLSNKIQHYSVHAQILENAYQYEANVQKNPEKYGKEKEQPAKEILNPEPVRK